MRRSSPRQIIDSQPQLLALLIVAIGILGRFVPAVNLLASFLPRDSVASLRMEMGGLEPPTSWLQTTRSPSELHPRRWQWAYLDSNQGPQLYQSCALAN